MDTLKAWTNADILVMFRTIISHLTIGDACSLLFGPLLLLVLTVISWYFRPSTGKSQ